MILCMTTQIDDSVMQPDMTMIRANFTRLESKQSATDSTPFCTAPSISLCDRGAIPHHLGQRFLKVAPISSL